MELGFIGLGKMGSGMVKQLLKKGHKVIVWNRTIEKAIAMEQYGAITVKSIKELVSKLKQKRRIIWLMITAGKPTINIIKELSNYLKENDLIIDGGNSNFNDSTRMAKTLLKKKIRFMDIGVSGGVNGYKKGYCLMAGGYKEDYEFIKPILNSLSQNQGCDYVGENGAGHFTKMVHNAIEYGMMQSIAEGFNLLSKKGINLQKVSNIWSKGSIIESRLINITSQAFNKNPNLKAIKPYVNDSGEGRWAVMEAIKLGVPFSVNTNAVYERFNSRRNNDLANKLIALMRYEFGGHEVRTE